MNKHKRKRFARANQYRAGLQEGKLYVQRCGTVYGWRMLFRCLDGDYVIDKPHDALGFVVALRRELDVLRLYVVS